MTSNDDIRKNNITELTTLEYHEENTSDTDISKNNITELTTLEYQEENNSEFDIPVLRVELLEYKDENIFESNIPLIRKYIELVSSEEIENPAKKEADALELLQTRYNNQIRNTVNMCRKLETSKNPELEDYKNVC